MEKIMRWAVRNKKLSTFREKSNKANGLLFDSKGRLLACEGGTRRVTLTDMTTGKITVLANKFDGLFNNVGLVNPAPLEEITLEDFDACSDVNLRCSLQAAQAVVPHMKERGSGRILFTSSMVVAGVPFRSSYSAAKAGMVSFTRSWALELAPFGITVNSVAPGPVETELFNTNNPPGSESRARYIDGVPMKRVGAPEELAAANCYFLVGESGFTTGQTLFVDGGYMTGKSAI